ncbi:hypothetical protein H2248_005116 [Termitomyces sp. 'cryptogamus']|nr:hypothetical protein H2248_005116 [Termitomyces sp. 'cryptogamus']
MATGCEPDISRVRKWGAHTYVKLHNAGKFDLKVGEGKFVGIKSPNPPKPSLEPSLNTPTDIVKVKEVTESTSAPQSEAINDENTLINCKNHLKLSQTTHKPKTRLLPMHCTSRNVETH